MDVPKEFFTLQSMLTLSGATGATFVVSNGIQQAFNIAPKWLALAVAETICIAGAYFSHGVGSDYFVGVINGFLVYCTAAGATSALGNSTRQPIARGELRRDSFRRRTFLSPWF
jgi:hypothetical protein